MKFGLPRALLRTYRSKVPSRDDGGVQESFHRMIKDQDHFVSGKKESIEYGRGFGEQRGCRSDGELLYRDEWWYRMLRR